MITRPSLIYKSEEMNLDLVEQAIQNIIKRGFGAAGPAITASQLCPAVMEIVNKYFNTYRTRHNLYYAPKSTPASRVIRWLSDDFVGTMENPGWF